MEKPVDDYKCVIPSGIANCTRLVLYGVKGEQADDRRARVERLRPGFDWLGKPTVGHRVECSRAHHVLQERDACPHKHTYLYRLSPVQSRWRAAQWLSRQVGRRRLYTLLLAVYMYRPSAIPPFSSHVCSSAALSSSWLTAMNDEAAAAAAAASGQSKVYINVKERCKWADLE